MGGATHCLDKISRLCSTTNISSGGKLASARSDATGLRGMRGYLDYALDHPNLFRYMYFSQRADVLAFPDALKTGKLPSLKMLHVAVSGAMQQGKLRADDVSKRP